MCPITIGTLLAVGGTVGGAGAGAGAGIIAGGVFGGMSAAGLGMTAITTALSGASAVMQQKAQRDRINQTNEAMTRRARAQAEISNQALLAKQDATSDRLMEEGRLHSQKSQERQR